MRDSRKAQKLSACGEVWRSEYLAADLPRDSDATIGKDVLQRESAVMLLSDKALFRGARLISWIAVRVRSSGSYVA